MACSGCSRCEPPISEDEREAMRRAALVTEALSKCAEMLGLVVSLIARPPASPLSGAEWTAVRARHNFAMLEMAKAAVYAPLDPQGGGK